MSKRTSYGDLTFDATLSAQQTTTAEITDFPVEEGANPSDHIREKPKTISLEVIFTPLDFENPNAESQQLDNQPNTASFELQKLHDMIGQVHTLDMPWRWEVMTNMAISSIGVPVNAGMEGFKVKVDFKQLRFVSSDSVRFERKVPTAVPKKPTVKPEQGKKNPTPETPQLTSIAKQNGNAWGIFTPGSGVAPQ